jgi:hypothetical protein
LGAGLVVALLRASKISSQPLRPFNTDFMAQFEARPDETLQVMVEQEFLLPEMCSYLGRFFFFEKHEPAGRQPWVDRYSGPMNAALGPENTRRCLDAFWRAGS